MIFASFGNSPVPFLRMAEGLDNYARESGEVLIVQCGKTVFPFKHCIVHKFMDKQTFLSHLKECEVAILQGGWGGISEASEMGVRMVVVPRINGIEHHHDQEQLVRALEAKGNIIGCYELADLPMLIHKAKNYNFKPIHRGDASDLIMQFLDTL